MSNWTDVSFKIRRHSDRQLLQGLVEAFRGASVSIDNIQIRWLGNNDLIQITADGDLSSWNGETALLGFAQANFMDRGHVSVARTAGDSIDTLTVHLKGFGNGHGNLAQPKLEQAAHLIHLLKTHLVELTHADFTSLFGTTVQKHFEEREASLAKLESILAGITHEFTEGAAQVRRAEDDHLRAQQERFRNDHEHQRTSLETEFQRKQEALAAREQALEHRLTEVDAQQARHARRRIREDLKRELANRSTKFELTAGTRGMRSPIQYVVLILLVVFLVLFVGGIWYALDHQLNDPWTSMRVASFAIAFASTLVFYLRWQNRWFEQHAQEEFRLKRMALDVDRASWVVEMAMEWKDEKGEGLPEDLLNRLSAHLFEQGAVRDEALHPADQLASALLGSAASLSVDLPGKNGSLKVDRRGLKQLQKDS